MTTDCIEQSRVHSVLSEQLHIFVDDKGVRRAAVGGYILDYTTFCTMLLWAMGGSVAYLSLMSENGSIDELKKLNSEDQWFLEKNNYRIAKYLYSKFGAVARQYTKDELAKLYIDAIAHT